MKKLFLLFILISAAGFSQNKFIEVLVKDTVNLKPKKYMCNITQKKNFSNIYAEALSDENEDLAGDEKIANKLKEIERQLERDGYKVMPLQIETIYPPLSTVKHNMHGLSVEVHSSDALEKIKSKINNFEDFEMYTEVIEYADIDKAEKILVNKLIDKARVRAAIFANSTGMKAGSIIELKQLEPQTNYAEDMADWYQSIMVGFKGRFLNDPKGTLTISLAVKFAAE
jgi:hypothetical protein